MTTSTCLGVHRREVGFTYHRITNYDIPEKLEEKKKERKKKVPFSSFGFATENSFIEKPFFLLLGRRGRGWRRRGRERGREESLTGKL